MFLFEYEKLVDLYSWYSVSYFWSEMSYWNCFCLTMNDEIMQISLHISLRWANSHSSKNKMKRWGSLGSILAQARLEMKLWMLSCSILLKQENFRLGEIHSCPSVGIIDLRKFNLALLGKWIWRLGTDKGGLWKEILDSKYGGWRSLREGGKSRRGFLWWKDLKEVWDSEGWGRSFEDGFKWKVGDGKEISF